MQYDPVSKTNGEWVRVHCMDKEFKLIQPLKTAMIYKKSFGRDPAALEMPGSFASRARSKSQSRERSLSAGKNRSTSKGSSKNSKRSKGKRASSANPDNSPSKEAGKSREKILR